MRAKIDAWTKTYLPPLTAAALTTLLLWLPILIPAARALNTNEPFKLVNAYNLRSNAEEEKDQFTPLEYIQQIRAEMDDFFTENLLLFIGGIFLTAVLLQPHHWRKYLYIALWFGVFVLPSIVGARLATARYFMPMSAPLMFALAFVIVSLWDSPVKSKFTLIKKAAALVAAGAAGLWLASHAIPFARTDLTEPDKLAFSETNYTEYQSGFLIANDAERQSADFINALTPPPTHIIANWNLCHMLYFYTEQEIPCLRLDEVREDLVTFMDSLPDGERGYLILSGYRPFFQQMPDIGWEEVTRFKQEKIRTEAWDVQIWRVWRTE